MSRELTRVGDPTICNWGTCLTWPPGKIERMMAGRTVDALGMLDDELELGTTPRDRLWSAMHPEVIPAELHESICAQVGNPLLEELAATDPQSLPRAISPTLRPRLETAVAAGDVVTASHRSIALAVQLRGKPAEDTEVARQAGILRNALTAWLGE